MPAISFQSGDSGGLTREAVVRLQTMYGKNEIRQYSRPKVIMLMLDTVKDPMVALLVLSGVLYFFLGQYAEGIMMLLALFLVLTISFYQELRSSNAISRLKEMMQPDVTVIRDGKKQVIHSRELVPGDIIWLEEGQKVPADAGIMEAHDLTVNESLLTGESMPVAKSPGGEDNQLFQGTLISSGSCLATVLTTGNSTRLAAIGKLIDSQAGQKTLLQRQTTNVVKKLALFGLVSFVIILAVNYLHYRDFVLSLLFALTLAMSVIPEEIPVAFSSFMALGAYKLSRLGVFVRQPQILENLGCMDVICLDKTGTITENKMVVRSLYDPHPGQLTEAFGASERLLRFGALASESAPFDPMEKAIIDAFDGLPGTSNYQRTAIIHEYPVSGTPPMMTHIYDDNGNIIAAAKGAPERIMNVCHIPSAERSILQQYLVQLGKDGLRVLGVASAIHTGDFPVDQDDFKWKFEGFIALYDPPKKNAPDVIRSFYESGLDIKLLTGDYPETAIAIARQAGFQHRSLSYTGDQVMAMNDTDLQQAIISGNIFSRMYPEAKLRLVNMLAVMGHTTGMTGDGVNDAPALKAAAIGIAMGKRGTEMARQAADLVIADDDLSKISLAINDGRKIFHNLRKAIRYIISIHIPILLIATVPVILGWKYPNIFTPVHIIFLELIMGPTCSVFFEKEPVEQRAINAGPRKKNASLLETDDLLISTVQGMVIAVVCLFLYYFLMKGNYSLENTRTAVFVTLIVSNILLTFSTRSRYQTIVKTIRFHNPLALPVFGISIGFLLVILFFPPARVLFGLTKLSLMLMLVCIAAAAIGVLWFEVYKANLPDNGGIRLNKKQKSRLLT